MLYILNRNHNIFLIYFLYTRIVIVWHFSHVTPTISWSQISYNTSMFCKSEGPVYLFNDYGPLFPGRVYMNFQPQIEFLSFPNLWGPIFRMYNCIELIGHLVPGKVPVNFQG